MPRHQAEEGRQRRGNVRAERVASVGPSLGADYGPGDECAGPSGLSAFDVWEIGSQDSLIHDILLQLVPVDVEASLSRAASPPWRAHVLPLNSAGSRGRGHQKDAGGRPLGAEAVPQ